MRELVELRERMQKLAEWHEQQRDAMPQDGGYGHIKSAVEHNRAASDCYSAAIAIGQLIQAFET